MTTSIARRVRFEDPQQYLSSQRENLRARQIELRERFIVQRTQELAIAEYARRQKEFEEIQRREIEYLERVAAYQKEQERCLQAYEEQQRRQREISKQRRELEENEQRLQLRSKQASWYTKRKEGVDVYQDSGRYRPSGESQEIRYKKVVIDPLAKIINDTREAPKSPSAPRKLLKRRSSQKEDAARAGGATKHDERDHGKAVGSRQHTVDVNAPKLSPRKSGESMISVKSSSKLNVLITA